MRERAACSYRPENGNNVPPESGDTLLSREQNKKRKEKKSEER